MRSFVVTMLFAAVIAEDGYTCTDASGGGGGASGDWGDATDLSGEAVTTADECKTACDTAVDGVDNDWCCFAVAVAEPESLACSYFTILAAELDIRAEAEVVDGTTYSAWAWGAGVALEDLAEEEEVSEEDDDESTEDDEEDDEDMSVRMTASAVAAASIAMLAM